MSAGLKYDSDKPRWNLLPLATVQEVVKVLTFGASKYGANNWQKLKDAQDRYFAALMRHLTQWQSGEHIDKESGLPHLAHAACDVMFLLWFEIKGGKPKREEFKDRKSYNLDEALKQGMKREELFSQLMFASDGMRTAGSMKMSERKTGTRKAKEDCNAAH